VLDCPQRSDFKAVLAQPASQQIDRCLAVVVHRRTWNLPEAMAAEEHVGFLLGRLEHQVARS
jgi:hypothetical protein